MTKWASIEKCNTVGRTQSKKNKDVKTSALADPYALIVDGQVWDEEAT